MPVLIDYNAEQRFLINHVLHDLVEEQADSGEQAFVISILRLDVCFNRRLQMCLLLGKCPNVGSQLLEPVYKLALPRETFDISAQCY